MDGRTIYRLRDALDAIEQIEKLSTGKTMDAVFSDRIMRAAFERFIEILSEASRHIPEELKKTAPQVEWQNVAGIGNHLRHAYHRVDAEILWRLQADGHLSQLKAAIEGFVARAQGEH